MIDLITLVKNRLSDDEITTIVENNHLQTNSKDGAVYYDNMSTKNFVQDKGIFIRIETNQKLKIEGSLHKFRNEAAGRDRNNYNLFTMSEARDAMFSLAEEKNIDIENLRVYHYEIGLNLEVDKDCQFYLDKMKSIGPMGSERLLYVNPIYVNPMHRNEKEKVTGSNKVRKHYKVYDKKHEMQQKKRKIIPSGNILRIETVYRRLDNCFVVDFFSPDNLMKMVETFFREWRTIQFERDIITPKGTGRAKQQLCMQIIEHGRDGVLINAKERHQNGSLKDWEYRNIREFIQNDWDTLKEQIEFVQSEEEKEFRQLMKIKHALLRSDTFIK